MPLFLDRSMRESPRGSPPRVEAARPKSIAHAHWDRLPPHSSLEEIDETELFQRQRLDFVANFLEDHDADAELVDALAIAINDLDQWIDEEIAIAVKNGTLAGGNA